MPQDLQSLNLNKILTELGYLRFCENIIQQHLTIRAAYISDYIKPLHNLRA